MKMIKRPVVFLLLGVLATSAVGITGVAHAQEDADAAKRSSDAEAMKFLSAGIAFGLAAFGSGIGLGYVGSASLAAISENPAVQSKAFIFVGMVESIAIYGIVMMFIILGQ